MKSDLQTKVKVLKKYEAYCYRLAMYLLKNEEKALEASIQSILELSQDEGFFCSSEPLQKEVLKRVVIKNSLNVKRRCMKC